MKYAYALDAAILAWFTGISHQFQRLTGRTNFFLAKLCLCGASTSILVFVLNYWMPLLSVPSDLLFAIVMGIFLLYFLVRMRHADQMEERSSRINEHIRLPEDWMLRNEFVPFPAYLTEIHQKNALARLGHLAFCTFFFILSLYIDLVAPGGLLFFKLLKNIYFPCMVASDYFMAVFPLPPGKSKIREWAESFAAGLKKLMPSWQTN